VIGREPGAGLSSFLAHRIFPSQETQWHTSW
jgi:hypothetical protein